MPGTMLVSLTQEGVTRELWRFGPPAEQPGPTRYEVHVYLPAGKASVVRFNEPDEAYRMME